MDWRMHRTTRKLRLPGFCLLIPKPKILALPISVTFWRLLAPSRWVNGILDANPSPSVRRVLVSVCGGASRVTQRVVLGELDRALTDSIKVVATLGDEFLVYLIEMALFHVRKTPPIWKTTSNRSLSRPRRIQDPVTSCCQRWRGETRIR